ncbi:hypothetical protein [Lacticaseibacillus rhamnosus]|uniref:hypothetical protein n=1 Tax=Lacticaseibacillus rhamnosus TaxID=47715 RepID=UPI0007E0DE88|nr:hypothetical protein [Lacticaseibacillus rhamnosus]MCZ2733700.1 hypothetical protein [Lacticaseibacillus rhamnosus]MCZ2736380.1 hypothetical protein [Lacticaseibacillus rhamnosus]MCZ2742714.1 hypothetical protein [Lacticaseibacillus rhamnosus]MCZ2745460.1 hypothetical protein [Lacticaseibacillus rhamnosus]MCZ2748183.1 hypothetical protein [Lacticaseibacillus rhamnosus]
MADRYIRNLITWIIVILGTIITGFCVIYQYRHYAIPKSVTSSRYVNLPRSKVEYRIESITTKDRKYTEISGWIFVKKQKPEKFVTRLALYEDNSSKNLVFPLKMVKRVDIAEKRKQPPTAYNYINSGFSGYIPNKYTANQHYKIGFLIADGQKTRFVRTGIDYKVGDTK